MTACALVLVPAPASATLTCFRVSATLTVAPKLITAPSVICPAGTMAVNGGHEYIGTMPAVTPIIGDNGSWPGGFNNRAWAVQIGNVDPAAYVFVLISAVCCS